MEKDFAMDTAD